MHLETQVQEHPIFVFLIKAKINGMFKKLHVLGIFLHYLGKQSSLNLINNNFHEKVMLRLLNSERYCYDTGLVFFSF